MQSIFSNANTFGRQSKPIESCDSIWPKTLWCIPKRSIHFQQTFNKFSITWRTIHIRNINEITSHMESMPFNLFYLSDVDFYGKSFRRVKRIFPHFERLSSNDDDVFFLSLSFFFLSNVFNFVKIFLFFYFIKIRENKCVFFNVVDDCGWKIYEVLFSFSYKTHFHFCCFQGSQNDYVTEWKPINIKSLEKNIVIHILKSSALSPYNLMNTMKKCAIKY